MDKEGNVLRFPLDLYDYMALKGFMEDLIEDENQLQLLPTSAPRLATII